MKLKFYGVRGSIPVCDAGFPDSAATLPAFKSHLRIQIASPLLTPELDFAISAFAPAYNPQQKIKILTFGRGQTIGNLREIFEVPLQSQYFPVQLDRMGAQFEFLKVQDASKHFTSANNAEATVTGRRHNHPGGAYGIRNFKAQEPPRP